MSDRADTLLLDLLDLTRGQRAALNEGKLDEALSFFGKRKIVIDRMHVVGRLTENQKMVIKDIISIDADISTAVQRSMSDIASRLDSIDRIRTYFQSSSPRGDDNEAGVAL